MARGDSGRRKRRKRTRSSRQRGSRGPIASPKVLSAIGAILGVFATVWSAFVGETIPELLRDPDARVREFRTSVDRQCGGYAYPSAHFVGHLAKVQVRFAKLDPPTQYKDEYRALEQNWASLVDALESVPESGGQPDLQNVREPKQRQSVGRQILQAQDLIAENTRLMAVDFCPKVSRLAVDEVIGLKTPRP
jgi:hypothetical protein